MLTAAVHGQRMHIRRRVPAVTPQTLLGSERGEGDIAHRLREERDRSTEKTSTAGYQQ